LQQLDCVAESRAQLRRAADAWLATAQVEGTQELAHGPPVKKRPRDELHASRSREAGLSLQRPRPVGGVAALATRPAFASAWAARGWTGVEVLRYPTSGAA